MSIENMKSEPYIGMPIVLGSTENQTAENQTAENQTLGSLPIAMTYTPMQQWKTTYSAEEALSIGTVFPELNLPFEGRRER